MRAELIYKCTRCGESIVSGSIESADEFSAADMTILHDCSYAAENGVGVGVVVITKIGLARLVGYDEYTV